jgi:translation initiation factor 2 subunit 3
MMEQPSLTIGIVGSVADGKTTLVQRLTGTSTARFQKEKEGNRTIQLGYANAKIYKCFNCVNQYKSTGSSQGYTIPECDQCEQSLTLVKHVSFLDCPGHEAYINTMVGGIKIMDCAILVIAADAPCPQPQTQEHLAALDIGQIQPVIICQNKIDLLMTKGVESVQQHQQSIKQFVQKSVADQAVIVPVSAALSINIDALLHTIVECFPDPPRDIDVPTRMLCVRSFDINKPGTIINDMCGGVLGGTLINGRAFVGQQVELRPGHMMRDTKTNKLSVKPMITTIVSLKSENTDLTLHACPGGLIGVQTTLNPELTKANSLVGHLIGAVGSLPPVYSHLTLDVRMVISRTEKMKVGENLLITEGAFTTKACLTSIEKHTKKHHSNWTVELEVPLCTEKNQRVAVSRKMDGAYKLCGYGNVSTGSIIYT